MLFFPLLCCKSILTPYAKWHSWQVSLLVVLELFARNKFNHIHLHIDVILLSQILFSLLRGGLVLCAVMLHVGYLSSFKGSGQGDGLTKAVGDCCLT